MRRHPAFIQEDQLLGRDRTEDFAEGLAPLLVGFRVALLRVK